MVYFNIFSYIVTFSLILLVSGLFIFKFSRLIVDAIDSTKYCLAFCAYYFKVDKSKIDKEMMKRYINPKDYLVIEKTKEVLKNLTMKIEFKEMKYSELKHPFFLWYGKIFCKSDGNDVIDIKDGKVGKISPDEKVKSCVLYDNFEFLLKNVEFANILSKKLEEAQYITRG